MFMIILELLGLPRLYQRSGSNSSIMHSVHMGAYQLHVNIIQWHSELKQEKSMRSKRCIC